MRLITPEFLIDVEDPFNGDCFNREDLATSLTNLITHNDDQFVISINAEWGEGKSTFLKMWMQQLANRNKQYEFKKGCVYYDAFASDYVDNPFIDIVSNIVTFMENEYEELESKEKELLFEKIKTLKDTAVDLGKIAFKSSLTLGLKVLTAKYVGKDEVTDLIEMKDKIFKKPENTSPVFTDELLTNYLTEKLDGNQHQKDILKAFKNALTDLGHEVLSKQGVPLVIIIDELDRCIPNHAIEILEKIKHLFSVKNVVFVLGINRSQLEESIKSIYGSGFNANKYLQKFINVECNLSNSAKDLPGNCTQKYLNYLYNMHDLNLNEADKKGLLSNTEILSNYYKLTLRDLEKVFTNYALYYSTSNDKEFHLPVLIVFLSIMKVIKLELFLQLEKDTITETNLITKSELSNLSPNSTNKSIREIRGTLSVCFLTGFPSNNSDEFVYRLYREIYNNFGDPIKVLSIICKRLNRFSLSL